MECAPPARHPWLRLAGLVVLLVVGVAITLTVPVDVRTVREAVSGAGAWAEVAFVAGYAAATLLVLPKNVLSVAAGVVFGTRTGVLLVWSAALLGASAAFWVGRALGRDGVHRLLGRHLDRLDRLVERRGGLAVLVARLVPVVPFTAVNYGSGITAVGFGPYLLATAVGILPGTVAYVVLGAHGSDPGSWPFLASLAALGLLAVVGVAVAVARRSSRA